MSPREFESARITEPLSPRDSCVVNNRPYFPKLAADPNDTESIFTAASSVVYYPESPPEELNLSLSKVTGGVTNAIFRVSGFLSPRPNSVLIRIFGADGMIDRDVETSAHASLSDAGIAVEYFGRFANGRVEGWLEGYRPLDFKELGERSIPIASELAKLHAKYHGEGDKEVILWNQIFEWSRQASTSVSNGNFLNENDCNKAKELLQKYDISNELTYLKNNVIPKYNGSKICYCHNDYQPLNIMVNKDGDIKMIDFEYGGYNYLAFDIANHFNEYAGGNDNAKPDYSLYPSYQKQEEFIKAYLRAYSQFGGEEVLLNDLMVEVEAFALISSFYWSLWAVNQASTEGCTKFDYLLYAENRLRRYQDCRK